MNSLLFCRKAPNGLRYPRWGGRRTAVQLEKCWGVEKCLDSRQNPQRRVHALLGAVELEDSLAKKRRHCQLTEILTHNLIFGNWQKAWFTKTPNNQKPWTTKKIVSKTRWLNENYILSEHQIIENQHWPTKNKIGSKTYRVILDYRIAKHLAEKLTCFANFL